MSAVNQTWPASGAQMKAETASSPIAKSENKAGGEVPVSAYTGKVPDLNKDRT